MMKVTNVPAGLLCAILMVGVIRGQQAGTQTADVPLPQAAAAVPADAAVTNLPPAVRAWRQMAEASIAYGDKYLNPEDIRSDEVFSGAGAGSFYQRGLEYVAFLLATKRNVQRANDVLDAFLDTQVTDINDKGRDGQGPSYGLFRGWAPKWSHSHSFTYHFYGPFLGYIALRHKADLRPEVREKLMAAIRRMVHYATKIHPETLNWTNGYALSMAGVILCGAALEDRDEAEAAIQYGERMLDTFANSITTGGLYEHYSSVYTAVTIGAFEHVYACAPNERIRRKAATVLNFLYSDVLQQYHLPSATVIATDARGIMPEGAVVNYLIFKQFGYWEGREMAAIPSLDTFRSAFVFNAYPLPQPLKKLFFEKKLPFTVRNVHQAYGIQRTSYLAPDFGLASNSEEPLQIVIGFAGAEGSCRSAFAQTRNFFDGSAVPGTFGVFQEGPRLLMCADFKTDTLGAGYWDKGSMRYRRKLFTMQLGWLANAEPYGIKTDGKGLIQAIRVNREAPPAVAVENKTRFDIALAHPPSDGLIAVQAPRAYLGIRILAMEKIAAEGKRAPLRGVVRMFEPAIVVLDLPDTDVMDFADVKQVRVSLALWLASATEFKSLADFEAAFLREKIRCGERDSLVSMTWQRKDGALDYLFDPAKGNVSRKVNGKEQDWNFMYESPFLHLKKGEALRGWDGDSAAYPVPASAQ